MLTGLLAGAWDRSIMIEPDFVDAAFEVDGSGRFRFVPLRLVVKALGEATFWLFGRAEPVAVLISGRSAVCAVDLTGKPADLDRLLGETAGLSPMLESTSPAHATGW